MSVRIETNDNIVKAFISGEIDHHTAMNIRSEIDMTIMSIKPKTLVLDFGGVTFMDSSGIGLVMGRYNAIKEIEGVVILENTSSQIKKVMKLSGLDRIAKIK